VETQRGRRKDEEVVSHIRILWELWDTSPPFPNAPTTTRGECWHCGLVPDPPGVNEGSRAGLIRSSPKTYRRIDSHSIEGHRLPLDAHMTGGEGRRPGARGCGCGRPSFSIVFSRRHPYTHRLFTTCETGREARSPRPRPRRPGARATGSRRRRPSLSRLVGAASRGACAQRARNRSGSYARRAPMKVSLPRVRYGRGDDTDITFLQHKLGLSLSASRVARPIGRLESVSYQFVEAVLVFAHALAKR